MDKEKIKILALADIHSPESFYLSDAAIQRIDLIITLGDISEESIDYILFMAKSIPVIGVPGNHDPGEIPGLDNIHGKTKEICGYTFGGFGGAQKYKEGQPNHYTEKQVAKVVDKMPAVDIFISHSPPFAVSQDEDKIHQGFKSFDEYMKRQKPHYWFHGHTSSFYSTLIGQTIVRGIDQKRFITLFE